jgi:thiamine pyrophosphokinase
VEGFYLRVLIVANGEITSWERFPFEADAFNKVIAVDGGYHHCQTLGLNTDIVIGDLDSLHERDLEKLQHSGTQLLSFPAEKDEIDLELALIHAVEIGAEEIVVLGGLGGRFDMSLANLSLLAHPELSEVLITFWHNQQKIWLVQPPMTEIKGNIGDTLSLIPFGGEVRGIQTTNLAYPLQDESLPFGPARGVSNVFTADIASISLESGMLLAVWTRGSA